MKKLAGCAAVAVALLACDVSNPVAPGAPQTPGTRPGATASAACPSQAFLPASTPFTSAGLSRTVGDVEESVRVSIRLEANGKLGLTVGSRTDRAMVTIAHEPGDTGAATVSTSLGFFEGSADAAAILPVQRCGITLSRPSARASGEDPAEQCRRAMGREERKLEETCLLATLALKPGDEVGEARIAVELGDFLVLPDPVPILQPDDGDSEGNP